MGRFSACGGGTIEITCPDKDVAHAIYKAIEDLIYTAKERMMNSNQNQVRSQRERATFLAGNSNSLPISLGRHLDPEPALLLHAASPRHRRRRRPPRFLEQCVGGGQAPAAVGVLFKD